MVWLIDIGDFESALSLAEFVLRHKVPMPSRYERDAATIIVEEIADAAIKAQNANESFSLDILDEAADLTAGCDIPDPVRATLFNAIGTELIDPSEDAAAQDATPVLTKALELLHDATSTPTT